MNTQSIGPVLSKVHCTLNTYLLYSSSWEKQNSTISEITWSITDSGDVTLCYVFGNLIEMLCRFRMKCKKGAPNRSTKISNSHPQNEIHENGNEFRMRQKKTNNYKHEKSDENMNNPIKIKVSFNFDLKRRDKVNIRFLIFPVFNYHNL